MIDPSLERQIREKIFADPQRENYICAAGVRSLQDYLSANKLRKGFAVLSDYSVYCKGEYRVRKKDSTERKRLIEYRIDIPDIADVRYTRRNPIWLLSISLFFLILAPVLLILMKATNAAATRNLTPLLDAGLSLLLSGVFALFYFLHRKKMIRISYSRGYILLNCSHIQPQEETAFVTNLRNLLRTWDAYVEQQNQRETYDQAYSQAYNAGYQSGYHQAYTPGYVQGYQTGTAQANPERRP